jgi:hypothetical protein
MRIRIGCVLPALLVMAGCATTNTPYRVSEASVPAVAPPQRVDAVSSAIGAKMDSMLASRRNLDTGVMR